MLSAHLDLMARHLEGLTMGEGGHGKQGRGRGGRGLQPASQWHGDRKGAREKGDAGMIYKNKSYIQGVW